jgi:AcrR family transcriptional regulator
MSQKDERAAPKPQRGRPRDPERRERILEAARSHFYSHGLERASLDAIAADAGVSKMTVYSHFKSKEGLFEAVIQGRTERVMGGAAGAQTLDPQQPEQVLFSVGEKFLMLTREEDALGKFRSVYGAAGSQPEACRAFYRQGSERLIDELATYLRRADAAKTLKVPRPRQAADLFLSMFMGDGHVRGLLMLDMPSAQENRALLREAVRVFMAAYARAA